jgi:hypothetical protein
MKKMKERKQNVSAITCHILEAKHPRYEQEGQEGEPPRQKADL